MSTIASLWVTRWQVEVFGDLAAEKALVATQKIVETLIEKEGQTLKNSAELLSSLPAVRASVITYDPDTIKRNTASYPKSLQLPIFDVFDSKGNLIVSSGDSLKNYKTRYFSHLFDKVFKEQKSISTVSIRDNKLVFLAASLIGNPEKPLGLLIVGTYLDNNFAMMVKKLSYTDVAFTSLKGEGGISFDLDNIPHYTQAQVKEMPLFGLSEGQLGKTQIIFSSKEFEKMTMEITLRVLFFASLSLIIALGISLWFAGTLARPIAHLKKTVERIIITNDLTGRVHIDSNDEISNLAMSFNHLIKEIEDSQKHLERKVQERTQQLADSKKNIQNVLDNLEEAYIPLNKKGVIQDGYSKTASQLFQSDLKGKDIYQLFDGEEKEEKLSKWWNLLFSSPLPFDDIKSLGPEEIQIPGGPYLRLDYRPIYGKSGELEEVILIAVDSTEQKLLEKDRVKDQQFVNMVLRSFKHYEAFNFFIGEAQKTLEELELAFKNKLKNIDVWKIMRQIHTIKGGCGSFYFNQCYELLVDFERSVADAEAKKLLSQEDVIKALHEKIFEIQRSFLRYLEDNSNFFTVLGDRESLRFIHLNDIEELLSRFKSKFGNEEFYSFIEEKLILSDFSNGITPYQETVEGLADDLGKQIKWEFKHESIRIDYPQYQNFFTSLIHIFRNIVDHGIEAPLARRQAGKQDAGLVRVRIDKDDKKNLITLQIEDDGQGIDLDEIKKKSLILGTVTETELAQMSNEEIYNLIFSSRFTTKEEYSEYSGLGIGLEVLKAEVDKLGGEINTKSKGGEGTCFEIKLPIIRISKQSTESV